MKAEILEQKPVPFPPQNFTRADLGSKPGLSGEGAITNLLSHGTALQTKMNLHFIYKVLFRTSKRIQYASKVNNLMLYREIQEVPLCCEERVNKMCGKTVFGNIYWPLHFKQVSLCHSTIDSNDESQ